MNGNMNGKVPKGRVRTSYSPQFKAQVVLEVLTGTKTVSEACRAYNLKYESLNRWRNHFLENADQLFQPASQKGRPTRKKYAWLNLSE